MEWRKSSEKTPPPKVDVYIKEYGGIMDIGWYSDTDCKIHTYSDLGPLDVNQVEWLDESQPSLTIQQGLDIWDAAQDIGIDTSTGRVRTTQPDKAAYFASIGFDLSKIG